ncbi:MAG: hypothetical protein CVU90_14730 [Firmicutes bacterium HGW-Firmicutes-15]|nr:MAG: hypothetical protein CVU90_14730 [Firmicutes bacterium HGW-Firmicutes-15]
MARLYRPLLVLTILILVSLALNTSNKGINSMTLDARKPVIGMQYQGDKLNIFALGETHSYDKRKAEEVTMLVWQQVKTGAQATGDHLLRFVRIIEVLF